MPYGGPGVVMYRVAGRATRISFPMYDLQSNPRSGLSVTGSWTAWSDTAGVPPAFANIAGTVVEVGGTPGIYSCSLAATELPAASPYVMVRFTAANMATQYYLIQTASMYANVAGVGGSTIAASVTAGYMPMDLKQSLNLSSPADNSVEKSLARTYMASPFATVATVSGAVWDEVITTGHSLDNTAGKLATRLYHATQYLDAAITSRLAPTTVGRTLDVDTAGGTEIGSVQAGAITSGAFAAGAIDAAALAANAIGASELAQDAAQEIADEVLNRNLEGGGSGNTYNVRNAFRRLRNRVQITGGNMLVYDETDTATVYAMSVTTAAGNPITEVDPIT